MFKLFNFPPLEGKGGMNLISEQIFLMNIVVIHVSVFLSTAIKCKVPVIENGNVPGDTQEYNEHEVLHFACNPNYMPTDRRPTTCTIQRGRAEWIPTPYCESKQKLTYIGR